MATYQLSSEGRGSRGAGAAARGLRALRLSSAPERVAAALLVLILYAAFAHGAVAAPDEPRLQVAVAALAALVGSLWLWSGSLRASAPALGWLGVGLLTAFTIWSGVTLVWSVFPEGTWIEFNRYVTYTLVLVLAIMVGASARRATELVHTGFLAVALLVTAYALGQKLVPGLHVPGVFDLNQTGAVPRLQQPLGYWNALGLFISMGVPPALGLAVDRSRSRRLRLAALVSLQLMFLTIGLTYSRGGLLALGLGVAVAIAFSGARLRSLTWLAAASLGTLIPLVAGLNSADLITPNVSLGQRELTGADLFIIVIVCAAVLLLAGRRLLVLEQRVSISPARARRIARALIGAVCVVLALAVLAVAFSQRGLPGTISHAWHSFTTTRGLSNTDPNRLLSADSGNRVVWWKEALGAFSSRPAQGWGAGSFPVVHLLYRRNTLSVKQPHSVPLQYLAETGAIGALLAIGAFLALLAAGARAVRRLADPRQRIVAAALFGAAVAYGVHACYDWDADIPGVTLPALVLLGVLVGAARPAPREEAARSASAQPPARASARPPDSAFAHLPGPSPSRLILSPGRGLRLLAVVGLTLAMCGFALSAALPSLAGSKASQAVIAAAAGSGPALRHADQQATLAASLDPLSDAGLRVESTIALRRGQFGRARTLLIQALRRDPSDGQAWSSLIYVEILFGRLRAGIDAAQRVLQLDPEGRESIIYAGALVQQATERILHLAPGGRASIFYPASLAQMATLRLAQPGDSASSVQTPESTATTAP